MIPDDELLKHTTIVSAELSNVCNMKHIHKRCPLNFCKHVGGAEKVILSTDAVLSVIHDLVDLDYSGIFCFSIYNEPMLDPRLFYFLEIIKELSKGAISPFLITNGTYMDQQMIYDLCGLGLKSLWVSCYSDSVHEEFQGYDYPEGLTQTILRYKQLEVIDDTYTRPYQDLDKPCLAPLCHMVIRCSGEVHLCCRDFETRHIFGNIYDHSLIEIIRKGDMHKLHKELSSGNRTLDVCRRCNTAF